MNATYLGHASLDLTYAGKRIFVDPWLKQNPRCPEDRKTIEAADLILITHGHFDHWEPDLPSIIRRTQARFCMPPALGIYMGTSQGLQAEELNLGGTIDVDGIQVTAIRAEHHAHFAPADEMVGDGYPHEPFGYVLRAEGEPTVLISADTGPLPHFAMYGELYRPEIAFLPIGSRYTMGPEEAAWCAKQLRVKRVVPIHYGTFDALPGTAEAFAAALEGSGIEVVTVSPGQTI